MIFTFKKQTITMTRFSFSTFGKGGWCCDNFKSA
jgi:hypothetical protein